MISLSFSAIFTFVALGVAIGCSRKVNQWGDDAAASVVVAGAGALIFAIATLFLAYRIDFLN